MEPYEYVVATLFIAGGAVVFPGGLFGAILHSDTAANVTATVGVALITAAALICVGGAL